MNRTDRLTGIILALQHRQFTASQLAERFEVSRRTILRDIDALSQLGVPVIAVSGSGGGYSLDDAHWLKPIQLTGAEASALLLAARSLGTANTPFARDLSTALDKLRTALKPDVVTAAESALSTVEITQPRRADYLAHFDLLRTAIAGGDWLTIDYQSLNRQAEHCILPLALTATDGFWYCSAISAAPRARRQFRVDRILAVSPTAPPPDRDSIIAMATAPGSDYHDRVHPEIVVRLTYRGARLAEDLPHGFENVRQVTDDSWEMRFRCPPAELDYWARTLFAFGPHALALAPANLVTMIRDLITATTATYADSGSPSPVATGEGARG